LRIPFLPEPAIELVSQYEAVVMAGAKEPVTSYAFKGFDSFLLREDQKKFEINTDRCDKDEVLEQLADALKAPPASKIPANNLSQPNRPDVPHGELTAENICLTLAALQPENAIIVEEGLTTSPPYSPLTAGLSRHTLLSGAGGTIGWGIPCSIGASIASPDRPVINFQADGSAMYTIEALWTVAREALNITTLICSNRCYNIIKTGMTRIGADVTAPSASSLLDLSRPDINWVVISEGMGVPAVSVNNTEGLAREFRKALYEPGPHLIEMVMPPPKR
jgi:acetolactate synthase-1/2/3 large subunit